MSGTTLVMAIPCSLKPRVQRYSRVHEIVEGQIYF